MQAQESPDARGRWPQAGGGVSQTSVAAYQDGSRTVQVSLVPTPSGGFFMSAEEAEPAIAACA